MRKTRPILLPKPTDVSHFTSLANQSDIDDIESDHLDDTTNHSSEITVNIIVNDDARQSTGQLSNGTESSARSTYSDDDYQMSGPHSLQTDDMLEMLAEMERQSSDGIHLRVDLDSDGNDRPRQLGRRAEPRSRIVSITAERSSEGDQVFL